MSGAELVADAHRVLKDARERLLDPTPQGVDCARAAFAIAVERLSALHAMLYSAPDAGRGLLPAISALHSELEAVTLLLERAAWHQSNLLQRILQASRIGQGSSVEQVEAGIYC